jgi:hypothetical protein
MRDHAADDRTLQDDRAALNADPGQGSPLAEGEGAPLAQDGAIEAQPTAGEATGTFLGGVPIGVDPGPVLGGPGGHDPMATPDDRPIDD